jgi:hypothetical protein
MIEELRAVLPPALLAQLRLDSLTPIDSSFIDEALRESSADLLFSVELLGPGTALVHVLFEHQSTSDEPRVPPIVSVLLFQGPKPWPWPSRFSSVHAIVRLTLLALRNARSDARLFELVASAMVSLRRHLRGAEVGPALARLARYAVHVDEMTFETVHSAFENSLVPTEWSEAMVTTADHLQAAARRDVLLELLEIKFGRLDPVLRDRVKNAAPEAVIEWLRRFAVVDTLARIFAD